MAIAFERIAPDGAEREAAMALTDENGISGMSEMVDIQVRA